MIFARRYPQKKTQGRVGHGAYLYVRRKRWKTRPFPSTESETADDDAARRQRSSSLLFKLLFL